MKLIRTSKRDYHSSLNKKTYCDGIKRFLVQNPLGAQLGLGTQLRYKVPDDLRVEI